MSTPLSTRTVCCKLAVDTLAHAALSQTQTAFNAAASYCAIVAWEQAVTNKNKLHYLVYGESRITYGLGAQLACCARDKAAEAVRAARSNRHTTCPTFSTDSSIRYDARTYRLMSLDRVSLNTLTGRVIGQLVLGDFQRCYLYDTSQAHFRCLLCGHTAPADTNAAVNIARVAAVNQPIVSLLSHGIERADTSPRA